MHSASSGEEKASDTVSLKNRPAHHSFSLGSAYTGRDSGVVGYRHVSLELGPVVVSER
jgi:hypothetical protein